MFSLPNLLENNITCTHLNQKKMYISRKKIFSDEIFFCKLWCVANSMKKQLHSIILIFKNKIKNWCCMVVVGVLSAWNCYVRYYFVSLLHATVIMIHYDVKQIELSYFIIAFNSENVQTQIIIWSNHMCFHGNIFVRNASLNFEFNEFFRISEKIQFIMSNFNKRLVLDKPHFASKNVRFYEFEFGTEKYVADVQLTATHSVRKMLQKNSIHQSCTTELVPSAFSFAIEIFRWRSPPKYFTNRTHRCHFDRWSSNFHHEKKVDPPSNAAPHQSIILNVLNKIQSEI